MKKIDFFGGLHGNFLELAIAIAIDRIAFVSDRPMFNSKGSCHLKDYYQDYQPHTVARHWSYNNIPFEPQDRVIRIVLDPADLLIAVVNSFERAGDETIDLVTLETDTIAKLQQVEKTQGIVQQLINDHGVRKDYPRSLLRNYFYSMFMDPVYGLDMYNCFNPAQSYHCFDFGDFFCLDRFYCAMNQVAHYLDLDFVPGLELAQLHQEFLSRNAGYHKQHAARSVLEKILQGQDVDINLDIAQEAWIKSQIAKIFRCYDLPELEQDQWPRSSAVISRSLYQWKHQASS